MPDGERRVVRPQPTRGAGELVGLDERRQPDADHSGVTGARRNEDNDEGPRRHCAEQIVVSRRRSEQQYDTHDKKLYGVNVNRSRTSMEPVWLLGRISSAT